MIAFRCRHCRQTLEVEELLAGSQIRCPLCDRPVAVPYDITCDDWPALPEADTITVADMAASSQEILP